jgi:hypothetical protein
VSDTPIDLLASRVWSGSKWHYPHIEAMLAERELLRDELAAMRKQRDEARRAWCYTESCRRCEYAIEPSDEDSIAAENGWDCFPQKEGGGA